MAQGVVCVYGSVEGEDPVWADEVYGLLYLGVVEAPHLVCINVATVIADEVVEAEWVAFFLSVKGGEAEGDESVGHRIVLSRGAWCGFRLCQQDLILVVMGVGVKAALNGGERFMRVWHGMWCISLKPLLLL